jgi:pyruvate dehydrogenase E2 component (dihydrolipoamide acetyltransferase)
MAETITMPKLGFDMQEGTLVRWIKNEGEAINKGDVLAEIETDKATVEVESSAAGFVRRLLVDPGAVVPIGAAIAVIGGKDEKIDIPTSGQGDGTATTAPKKQEIKTEAAMPPQPTQKTPTMATPAVPTSDAASGSDGNDGQIKASPLAKKMAREANVNLATIQGSGPGGRVVQKDVETALSAGHPTVSSGQLFTGSTPQADETVSLTKLRQAIARRMTESKTTIPHFYVSHEYKMDAVMALRRQVNEFLPEDEKFSVNDFIVKAVALALRKFPNLNASFAGDKVLRHGSINVGVAVAVDNGLMTIVNKNTDQKPLRQISLDVKRMAAGARAGKVRPEDIDGSTFSISNLGMYDVENFIAILNPPEAAILAVGSAREVPVVGEGGLIQAGWRMKATISVDHRVSDGAEAAQFMQALAKYLEEPLRLLV